MLNCSMVLDQIRSVGFKEYIEIKLPSEKYLNIFTFHFDNKFSTYPSTSMKFLIKVFHTQGSGIEICGKDNVLMSCY